MEEHLEAELAQANYRMLEQSQILERTTTQADTVETVKLANSLARADDHLRHRAMKLSRDHATGCPPEPSWLSALRATTLKPDGHIDHG